MNLYLIRHAEAVPLGEQGITDDAERPLTRHGEAQSRQVGSALPSHGVRPEVILTSPLLRARQTAEKALEAWPAPAPELRIVEELAPGGGRKKLARLLRDLGKAEVALVGHEPDLGRFTAWLIGSKKARLDFPKAGVACVECPKRPAKGAGALRWLVAPGWFNAG